MEGFPRLVSLDEAKAKLAELLTYRISDILDLPLEGALGMVSAEDVAAPADVPGYDKSAVDGYAVVAEDTFGASATSPVELRVIGLAHAGDDPTAIPPVKRGEAVEVSTGAPMPKGANAVVMVEHVKREGDKIEVSRTVTPLQNVSRKGEDYKAGEVVFKKGTRIKPWHVAALAALNIPRVKVFRKPRVAIVSTGSELVDIGSELRPGKVLNSSKPMLKALITDSGGEAIDLGTVPDDIKTIRQAIVEGLRRADIVVVTGGTSVGELDLVPEAVNSLGKPGVVVHGVMIRPAKPTGFGFVDNKPVFMLSGFPVSTLIGFQLFVRPAIDMMVGAFEEPKPKAKGKLTRRVTTPPGVRSFVRARLVRWGDELFVEPLMLTGSGLLSTLTKANAMLVVPENVEGYEEGEEVEVEVLQALEAVV